MITTEENELKYIYDVDLTTTGEENEETPQGKWREACIYKAILHKSFRPWSFRSSVPIEL